MQSLMERRVLLLLVLALGGDAATISFNNSYASECASGCPFTTASIWDGGVAPSNNDYVYISSATAITVIIGGESAVTIMNMTMSGPVTVYVTGQSTFNCVAVIYGV
jgi:hypothetical protein